MHEPEASSPDQRREIRLGRGEISPGCCYADPDNVDWSHWMPSHPPLLTASRLRKTSERRATFRIQTARQAMVKPFPSKTHIGNHMLHPETLMLNYGYDPQLSEGAVKPPIFLTSTFVFRTAEDGQDFFDFVSGRREPPEGMGAGLVYSRFNHPNSEIVEDRLSVYERTD